MYGRTMQALFPIAALLFASASAMATELQQAFPLATLRVGNWTLKGRATTCDIMSDRSVIILERLSKGSSRITSFADSQLFFELRQELEYIDPEEPARHPVAGMTALAKDQYGKPQMVKIDRDSTIAKLIFEICALRNTL
jgi:hypothetical protein